MEKHFATSCFVMNRKRTKVLMVYHKKLGVWVIPGGHLEPNEFPHEGAAREVLEETGVAADIWDCADRLDDFDNTDKEKLLETPFMMLEERIPAKGDNPEHIHMDFIFLGDADEETPLKQQEEEVEAVKWMTQEEILNSDTFPSVKALAKEYLRAYVY